MQTSWLIMLFHGYADGEKNAAKMITDVKDGKQSSCYAVLLVTCFNLCVTWDFKIFLNDA